MRNRSSGIQAIRSLVTADSFAADNGRQLQTVMPAVLDNVYSESPGMLPRLELREKIKEERDKEEVANGKQSTAIARAEGSGEVDQTNEFETTEDADERANEDVGVQALQVLRQIFLTDVPGQLRTATQSASAFVKTHNSALQFTRVGNSTAPNNLEQWSCEVFEHLSKWTPVQNRFVILVTLTDSLTKSPIAEEDLSNQLILVRIIIALLRSDITFIGLSVNDVLIGFINHILLLLQLGGPGSGVRPHRQQTIAHGLLDVREQLSRDESPASAGRAPETERVGTASDLRVTLLDELSIAIGDLATHIYYADQVSEMVAALLLRLKPPVTVVPTTTSAIEDPSGTVDAIAHSGRLQEDTQSDEYFSFDTARILALNAIRNIIETANSRRKDGQASSNRNRVDVGVWDGTQWLLRDPRGKVRRAYVDALLTWLVMELNKDNLRVAPDQAQKSRPSKQESQLANGSAIAKRAVSNASKRGVPNTKAQSTFLQLLHLAVYENALRYAESAPDMLLLHLLLVSMIQRLGVNSVRFGLPMICRLQDDIPSVESIQAKDAIGSLVHGYFWALSEFFDFDNSAVGRDISNEISRRSQLGLWLDPINVPALPLDRIEDPPDIPSDPRPPTASQRTHTLQPLLRLGEVVDCISNSYASSLLSPPSSPAASPRRPLSPRASTIKAPTVMAPSESQLPREVREQLLHPWTREACIAEADKKLARSSSIANSKAGSGSGRGGLLTTNGASSGGHTPELTQRSRNVSEVDIHHPHSQGNVSSQSPLDRSSVSAPASAPGRNSIRVHDLKRILETGQPPNFSHYRLSRSVQGSDVDSESMVSADVSSVI